MASSSPIPGHFVGGLMDRARGMDPVLAHQDWSTSASFAIGPRALERRRVVYADSDDAWAEAERWRAVDPRHSAVTVPDRRRAEQERYGAHPDEDRTALARDFDAPTAVAAGFFDTPMRPVSEAAAGRSLAELAAKPIIVRSAVPTGTMGAARPRYDWARPHAERERAVVADPRADAKAIDEWGARIGGLAADAMNTHATAASTMHRRHW